MSNDDNYIKILDRISEVAIKVGSLDVRCESIEKELSNIHDEDRRTNSLLEEHIRNTKTNTERLNLEVESRKKEKVEMDSRLSRLEKIPQFFGTTFMIAKYIAAIGSAIGVIYMIFS